MAYDNFIEEHPPWQRLLSDISNANTATIEISENGEYDVRNYAYASVNVSGGVTLGNLASGLFSTQAVSVGLAVYANEINTVQVKIGNTVVADGGGANYIPYVASGAKAVSLDRLNPEDNYHLAQAYDVTINESDEYATVDEINMDVTSTTVELEGVEVPVWEYTVPSIAEGHYYVLEFANQSQS